MSCSPCIVGKAFGIIAISSIAALGGYNLVTTGCVTGACASDSADSAIPAVGTDLGAATLTDAALTTTQAASTTEQTIPVECTSEDPDCACDACVLEAETQAKADALEEAANKAADTAPTDG